MATLEIVHVDRVVQLHTLDALAVGRFETWVRLPERTVTFGRSGPVDGGSHIDVHDGNVSRQHGAFVFEARGWAVVDRDSTGGTFINGHRQLRNNAPYRLRDGDVVRFGDASGRFHVEDPDLAILDPTEQGLVAAIRERTSGSLDVYLDWLEQEGHLDRVEWLRIARRLDAAACVGNVPELRRYVELSLKIDRSWRVRLIAARGRP